MNTRTKSRTKTCAVLLVLAMFVLAIFGADYAFGARADSQKTVFGVREAFLGDTFDGANWQVVVKKTADAAFEEMNAYSQVTDWYITGEKATLNAKKYIPEGETGAVEYLLAWGGEWLSNNNQYISGYKFTAPASGTLYIKDLIQSRKESKALYKIFKESGGSQTAVFPTEGADADGYLSIDGTADNAGSAKVNTSVSVEAGDALYFVSGKLDMQIITSPVVSYLPFENEYSLKEYFSNHSFMHRSGEFDVMVDNKGAVTALDKLDPMKGETDIFDRPHNAALYFTEAAQYVGAYGNYYLHAGGDNQNVFYRFTAPVSGTVFIKDKISGNGEYKIVHNGVKIYPTDKDAQPAGGNTGVAVSVNDIAVAEGDTLDFVVLGRGGSTKTHVEPVISYETYQDIVLQTDKINLEHSENYTLAAKLTAIAGGDITWESSDPAVVSVTPSVGGESAELVGLKDGKATVTVKSKDSEISKSCAVTVYKAVAAGDVIDVASDSYVCGNAGTVYFSLASDSDVAFDKLIIKKNGAAVLTVNAFSGRRLVTDLFTVTNGDVLTFEYTGLGVLPSGCTRQIKYTENNGIESDKIDFKTSDQLLDIGARVKLEYTILPTASKDKAVEYSSDNPSIVKIQDGELVALAGGKAVITVKIQGTEVLDTLEVTVMTKGNYVYDSIKDFTNVPSPIWGYYYQNHVTAEEPSPVRKPLSYNTQGLIEEVNEAGAMTMGYKYVVGSELQVGVHDYLGIWNGEFMHPGNGADVLMVFKAPMKGRINIYDTIKALPSGSDGTNITVLKNTSKIFPQSSESYLHLHDLSVLAIENIDVKIGDEITFVVNKNLTLSNDLTYLNPTIYYTQSETPDMKIELNFSSKELSVGGVFLLEGKIIPDIIVDNTFSFVSADSEVATVEDGVVTAVAAGTTTITVSHSSGISAVCTVTVLSETPPPPPDGGDTAHKGCGAGILGGSETGGIGGPMGGLMIVCAVGFLTVYLTKRSAKRAKCKSNQGAK